ncbi:MAG TPA: hypothetical protein VK861_06325 [Bacteroidales bacterium]|nr:hypothetical protein [Bacteroidales bacterium]
MCLQESVMWIDVKIQVYLLLKSCLKLVFQIIDKFSYPTVVTCLPAGAKRRQVDLLPVADEEVVGVSGDKAGQSVI